MEKAEKNMETFLEHGPGLKYDYETWIIYKSEDGEMVFTGGLGGMGVGQMWCPASKEDKKSKEYKDAPVKKYLDDPFNVGNL